MFFKYEIGLRISEGKKFVIYAQMVYFWLDNEHAKNSIYELWAID